MSNLQRVRAEPSSGDKLTGNHLVPATTCDTGSVEGGQSIREYSLREVSLSAAFNTEVTHATDCCEGREVGHS